jgi:Mitochondrial ribosomal protein (VAR1)
MFNDEFKTIKPLIFIKKLNNNCKIISFNKIRSTLGHVRYFPPATQEWYNSIYSYDKNYIKNITIADKNLVYLIKSYFNLYFNNKLLRSKRIMTRLRRFSMNKIFISKTELKHTSSKVIITLYVYNEERRILLNKISRIETKLFSYVDLPQDKKINLSLKEKINIIKNIKKNLDSFKMLKKLNFSVSEEIRKIENNLMINHNQKDKEEKQLELDILKVRLKYLKNIQLLCEKFSNYNLHFNKLYSKHLEYTILEKEMLIITYYKLLINLNRSKFEDKFLLKLKPLISKIYNKEVEFNIVDLKAVYLNSHILTEVISLKLKNRKNKLLDILSSFLYMVKLPKMNFSKENFAYVNPRTLLNNKIKNLRVNNLIMNINNKDGLNRFLLNIFKNDNYTSKLEKCISNEQYMKEKTINLLTNVLHSLKYKEMGGIRLEVKGRLTRRLTASRSIFKIRWKGNLKNIDSSYRGLSSVILRGYNKSNVQYSIVNSKTRNGSFGLKGWISGKK